jgi:nucleotide-binding universal stress UspA family protein
MYQHILIATDGSELAEKAVVTAFALAKRLECKITAVTVTEPWTGMVGGEMALGFPYDEYEKSMAATAAKILSAVEEAGKKAGVACASVHKKDQYPAEGIIEAAREQGCDLIVMASHGRRGVAKLLLGSQATKVVTLSPVAVLVCR